VITKAQIKYINSLRLKKNRQTQMQFIAEGVKIVDEILNSALQIDSIFATKEWINKSTVKYPLIEVTEGELKKISSLESPNEVLAIVIIPETKLDINSLSNELSLMLDNISDPGNMGTIIRIADWFGIKNIICSEDCVDIYNSKVVQATMGSITRVNCHYTNLENFLSSIKENIKISERFTDYKIYGAILNSESIYSKELTDKGIIIIGNESKGISSSLKEFITDGITIPGYSINLKENKAESLNVSVATGIICAEFRRRCSPVQ
jgi:RNA methyltransferase, TrmH family